MIFSPRVRCKMIENELLSEKVLPTFPFLNDFWLVQILTSTSLLLIIKKMSLIKRRNSTSPKSKRVCFYCFIDIVCLKLAWHLRTESLVVNAIGPNCQQINYAVLLWWENQILIKRFVPFTISTYMMVIARQHLFLNKCYGISKRL